MWRGCQRIRTVFPHWFTLSQLRESQLIDTVSILITYNFSVLIPREPGEENNTPTTCKSSNQQFKTFMLPNLFLFQNENIRAWAGPYKFPLCGYTDTEVQTWSLSPFSSLCTERGSGLMSVLPAPGIFQVGFSHGKSCDTHISFVLA